MCLIVFGLNQHPDYTLILVANRDEFYTRKTEPADYWPDRSDVLGGRDMEAMRNNTCGTWMGMTKSGKIAMVTNYRDFKNIKAVAPSRGHLVSDFLIQQIDPIEYLKQVEKKKHKYNGFNLIVGDPDRLYYLSNYKNGLETLRTGFYGLSNHLLETPWPKVVLAKSKLEPLFGQKVINPEDILNVMQDETRAPERSLPDTGIGIDRERALSSMFIKTDGYGTRCSTVVLIRKTGEVSFVERTYNLQDFTYFNRNFDFKIKA